MKQIIYILAIIMISILNLKSQEIFEMKSTAKGFSAELHFGVSSWVCDDLDVKNESGFHFGLKAGYGFTEWIEAFLEYDHSIINPEWKELDAFPYNHVDIGARFNFGSTIKAFRPFAEVSAMYQSSIQDAVNTDTGEFLKLDMEGYGLSVGGGLKYHLKLPIVILAGLKYSFGTFDTILLEGEEYNEEWVANSYRIYLGASYYF